MLPYTRELTVRRPEAEAQDILEGNTPLVFESDGVGAKFIVDRFPDEESLSMRGHLEGDRIAIVPVEAHVSVLMPRHNFIIDTLRRIRRYKPEAVLNVAILEATQPKVDQEVVENRIRIQRHNHHRRVRRHHIS